MAIKMNRKPFTNVCQRPGSAWFGKHTASVYDANGIKYCMVPSFGTEFSRKRAKQIAERLCEILNGVPDCDLPTPAIWRDGDLTNGNIKRENDNE